jgi:hypothetical protein
VVADERVEDTRGKVALERGPLVYAAEGVDNDNSVLDFIVADDARFDIERKPDLLGGITTLQTVAANRQGTSKRLTLIPYYAWSHRGAGEMVVWLHRGVKP